MRPVAGCAGLSHARPQPLLPPEALPAGSGAGPAVRLQRHEQSGQLGSARLGIQEFFEYPVLSGTITQALANNQELKILNQDIVIAQNDVLRRRGAYLPFFGLRGDAALDRHSLYTPLGAAEEQLFPPRGGNFPDPNGNFLVGTSFFWQIDIWRELRNARDAAQQRYCAAIERRNFFVTRLVTEVAQNYYELLALDARLQILDQTIAIQKKSLQFAEASKAAGRSTELPVQRFTAEVRRNESEILVVRQSIVEAENQINFLAGRYPQPVDRVSGNFVDLNLHGSNSHPTCALWRISVV